jgi:hypothetical protein
MINSHRQYNPPAFYEYHYQKRKRKVRELQRQLAILDNKLEHIKPSQNHLINTLGDVT